MRWCHRPCYQSVLGYHPLRIEENLSQAHLRLDRTTIAHLPWDQCITRYDSADTAFYLDPPYWGTTEYGSDFGFEHYTKMAELAVSCSDKVVISINDHPDIREVLSHLNC